MYCNANSSLTERTTLRCGLQFGAQNGVRMTRTRALRCFDVLAPPFARPDTPVVPDRDDAVSLHEAHTCRELVAQLFVLMGIRIGEADLHGPRWAPTRESRPWYSRPVSLLKTRSSLPPLMLLSAVRTVLAGRLRCFRSDPPQPCSITRARQLEVLAWRHQLQVLERSRPERLRLTRADRLLGGLGLMALEGLAPTRHREAGHVIAWSSQGVRLFRDPAFDPVLLP